MLRCKKLAYVAMADNLLRRFAIMTGSLPIIKACGYASAISLMKGW
jgi:hypothetical protein